MMAMIIMEITAIMILTAAMTPTGMTPMEDMMLMGRMIPTEDMMPTAVMTPTEDMAATVVMTPTEDMAATMPTDMMNIKPMIPKMTNRFLTTPKTV